MKAGASGEEKSICKTCRKPVDQAHYESHVSICNENSKKEAARRKKERKEARAREGSSAAGKSKDEDGDTVMSTAKVDDRGATESPNIKKMAKKASKDSATASGVSKKTSTPTMNKKRKADGPAADNPASSLKEPNKKKPKKDGGADETKNTKTNSKMAKPKGPVNVEIQCGVPLEKEGKTGFCARSLTCKSHSMGLKRAVPGRSMPYDQLLAQYQRRNNAKQQKALLEAHAAAAKKAGASGGLGGRYDDDDEYYGEGMLNPDGSGKPMPHGAGVGSEEEKDNVLKALAHWQPRPLEQVTTVPIGRRYRYIRLKEMLSNALSGSAANGGEISAAAAAAAAIAPLAVTAQKSNLFAVAPPTPMTDHFDHTAGVASLSTSAPVSTSVPPPPPLHSHAPQIPSVETGHDQTKGKIRRASIVAAQDTPAQSQTQTQTIKSAAPGSSASLSTSTDPARVQVPNTGTTSVSVS